MKATKKALIAILSISSFISACSKSNNSPTPTTNLQITVKDNLGNSITGATVSLFVDSSDYANGTNSVANSISDASGNVKFTNLSTIKYYFLAKSNCENNFNSGNVLANPLTQNATTNATAIISSTGILKLVNNSTNPYTIFINGTSVGTLAGGITFTYNYAPAIPYSVRVLQNSGYLLTPTDETFTGTLTCGGTLTVAFP
jgi:hypothetical protein